LLAVKLGQAGGIKRLLPGEQFMQNQAGRGSNRNAIPRVRTKLLRGEKKTSFYFFFSTTAVPLSFSAASLTLPLASRLNSMVTPL
jgi:hypothetical protein